jgi:hypothetical protein
MTMASTGIHAGIYGTAVARAAEAMLQAFGGDTITVLFPAAFLPNDPSAQLGLVDPGVVQINFSPVVARNLPLPSDGPRRRVELLISASSVADALISQGAPTAIDLFDGALGVMFDGEVFHIESVTADSFGGAEYLYHLLVVE